MFRVHGFRGVAPVLVALCCLVVAGQAQRPNGQHMPRGQKHSYQKEVEQLEEQWRQAQLASDSQVMERLLADDYIGITSTGLVVTKEEQLARTRNRTAVLTRMDVSDVKVRLIGSTAIVTSRVNAEGTNEGVPLNGMYRYTRVYGRMPNGTWKIVNFESTRIPVPGSLPPPPARVEQSAP